MSISYQFGDVDAHGALIRAQAASLEAEHQSIVRDVLVLGLQGGGLGTDQCAVCIHVAELVTDRHECSPKPFR